MACLDMYNSEHKGHHHHCPPMSPRISFSNDFAETQQVMKQERNSREAPVSSDFEFSVSNYSMMSADELFFKGGRDFWGSREPTLVPKKLIRLMKCPWREWVTIKGLLLFMRTPMSSKLHRNF
ncbi:hypothetical protein V6Z11_D11G213300 [Gossypium hirsutum]